MNRKSTTIASAVLLFVFVISVTGAVIFLAQRGQSDFIRPSVIETRSEHNEPRFQRMLAELKRASDTLEVTNLQDAQVTTVTEIRLWVGFGIGYPRCMIIEPYQKAVFLRPEVSGDRVVMDSDGTPAIQKTTFIAPRSGWDSFYAFLRNEGIALPIPLTADPSPVAAPDGETMAIEIKRDGEYGMVFYSVFSKSQDAQKTVRICRTIEQEFGVQMVCAPAPL